MFIRQRVVACCLQQPTLNRLGSLCCLGQMGLLLRQTISLCGLLKESLGQNLESYTSYNSAEKPNVQLFTAYTAEALPATKPPPALATSQ